MPHTSRSDASETGRLSHSRGGTVNAAHPGVRLEPIDAPSTTGRERSASIDREVYMAMDVHKLFEMSQEQLDDLFRKSPAGPIPDGADGGNRDRRAGHRLQSQDRGGDQPVRLAGQDLRRGAWRAAEQDFRVRTERDRRRGLQGARAGSTRRNASCSTTRRRRRSPSGSATRSGRLEPGTYLGEVYWEKKRLIHFALQFK